MKTATTPEMDALKARMRETWMAGDFGEVARHIEDHAEDFMARRSLSADMNVLDVACGTGNLALLAARAGAPTCGLDIAANLIEQARTRAAAAGLGIEFIEADAEDIPYEDGRFDLVVSMYGAMFAPRPEVAAAELLRVCRPGGEVVMANWSPEGFVAEMFQVTGRHVPPPPGVPSPVLWGHPEHVRERLGAAAELELTPVRVEFDYDFSPEETVEFYRRFFGPTQRAFAALDEAGQAALRHDLEDLWSRHNQGSPGRTHVQAEYLEVVARRGSE
jgi:SAM-dependent methyltransferase